jgi:hypothetical protein
MTKILYTSLDEIKSFDPCRSGLQAFIKTHGSESKPVSLLDCVKSNSISDVLWLIGKRKVEISVAVKFARRCADSVKHLHSDAASNAATYADDAADYYTYTYTYATASNAASNAASKAAVASNVAADYYTQQTKNKQFFIDCINEFQNT